MKNLDEVLDGLAWEAYCEDYNARAIKKFNIFNHYSFRNVIKTEISKITDYELFCDQMRSELMYYYWSKCEWETIWTLADDKITITSLFDKGNFTPIVIMNNDAEFEEAKKLFYEVRRRYIDKEHVKIDVYDQIMLHSEDFYKYVWNALHPRKKIEE